MAWTFGPSGCPLPSGVLRGALAGVAGTAALSGLAGLEHRWTGRTPVYDPAAMVQRLVGRRLGRRLAPRERRLAGELMRWPYGAAWGVGLALFGRQARGPVAGLGLGLVVWLFELVTLPATGATPRLGEWERAEIALDLLNTSVYGLVVGASLGLLSLEGGVQ
ncbi:MAG TPA: hypothetical protein VOB72_27585 [Candidatus Dormibacteraeota bacterium]|nr:hypothetical protein [Candidatus Dormibacteraeota bacterium]